MITVCEIYIMVADSQRSKNIIHIKSKEFKVKSYNCYTFSEIDRSANTHYLLLLFAFFALNGITFIGAPHVFLKIYMVYPYTI